MLFNAANFNVIFDGYLFISTNTSGCLNLHCLNTLSLGSEAE